MQFHAADEWRVVTGGSERLEVNNSAVTIAGVLNVRTAIDLADDDIIRLGSSDDAKIFYDGTNNDLELELESACDSFRITNNGTHKIIFWKSAGDLELIDGFFCNDTELNTTKTFPVEGTKNGGVFGPYTIASGVTLTISSGSTFTII